MRLIDADKLCPDCMTKEGTLAISQSQIANAPTVDFEKLGESLRCQIRAEYGSCDDCELSCPRNELIKLLDLERPTGHWIKEECSLGKTYYCSECYAHPEVCFDFCPYCGADMRGDKE